MWAGHRDDCNSYYNIYDGSAWGPTKMFDWKTQGCPWDGDTDPHRSRTSTRGTCRPRTRSSAASARSSTSPNFLVSTDSGDTWSYYGRITATPTVGYVSGYYKYWGNGADRIDFIGTEDHPRDFDNSLWHGYYKGGKLYKSDGTVVDDAAGADTTAKDVTAFTKVFATGSTLKGVKLEHTWNHDVVRYADGTIAVLGQGARDRHRNRTIRTSASSTRASTARRGRPPTSSRREPSSTPTSRTTPASGRWTPTTRTPSTSRRPSIRATTPPSCGKHEICAGATCDNGATFTWTPVTAGSTVDNIRPVVPKWDADHTALLWMQGTYTSAQNYAMEIVGTLTTKP